MLKKFALLIPLVLLVCFAASSQGTIAAIEISGLKRTKEFVLQREMKRFIGKEANDDTLHEIETFLQIQGLFNNIKVQVAGAPTDTRDEGHLENAGEEIDRRQEDSTTEEASDLVSDEDARADNEAGEPSAGGELSEAARGESASKDVAEAGGEGTGEDAGGVTVQVSLEEKISILPIPFAMVSNGDFSGGFFLFDSNALGLKHTFAVGGMLSADSKFGVAMYTIPAVDFRPGVSIATSVEQGEYEICDTNEDTVYEHESLSFSGSVTVEEKLTSFLSLVVETGFKMTQVDEDFEVEGVIETARAWKSGAGAQVSFHDWNGVFTSQKGLAFRGTLAVTTQNDVFTEIEASELFQQSLPSLPRLRFIHSAAGAWGFDTPVVFYHGGRSAAVSLFPDDFKSDRLAGCSTGFECAVFQTVYGIISLYGVYQAAVAHDFDDDYVFNQGAGGGMKIYLSKVAMPACAVEMIYNITEERLDWGFSLGVAF